MVSPAVQQRAWGERPNVPEVREIDDLDSETFVRDYVNKFRPVVIKGLAKEWASRISFDKLASHLNGDEKVQQVLSEPVPELVPDYLERVGNAGQLYLRDFIEKCRDPTSYLQAYAVDCTGPLEFLTPTGSERALLPKPARKRPRNYEPLRAFIASRAFTDWHYHFADETLTVQLVGEKELYFVAPADAEAFLAHVRKDAGNNQITGISSGELAKFSVFKAKLNPGDVLYIPVYWWHLARSNAPSITTAITFKSPLHIAADIRQFQVRAVCRDVIGNRRSWKFIPLMLLAIPYALLRNLFTRFDPREAKPA